MLKNLVGTNPQPSGSDETLWSTDGLIVYLSTATTLDIVSTDGNDTEEGTGARTVRLEGLDTDYAEITEDVTLTGATPVTTTNKFLRLNLFYVLTSGSGGANAGVITATENGGVTVLGTMVFFNDTATTEIYTVPAAKKAYLKKVWGNHEHSLTTFEYHFHYRILGGVWRTVSDFDVQTGHVEIPIDYTWSFAAKTDLAMEVHRETGAGNNPVHGGFTVVVIDN
jgi:hypothetical protein